MRSSRAWRPASWHFALTVKWFCDGTEELSVSAPGFSLQAERHGLFAHSALSPLTSVTVSGDQSFSSERAKHGWSERKVAPGDKIEEGLRQGRCDGGSTGVATLGVVNAQTLSPPFLASMKPPYHNSLLAPPPPPTLQPQMSSMQGR